MKTQISILMLCVLFTSCQNSKQKVETNTKTEKMQQISPEEDIKLFVDSLKKTSSITTNDNDFDNLSKIVKKYYKILPGTPEWRKLNSHSEMLKACEVSMDILKECTTKELLQIAMAYPLVGDLNACNNSDMIYCFAQYIQSNPINSGRLFLTRSDAPKEILANYKKLIDTPINPKWTSAQQGFFGFRLDFVRLFWYHSAILPTLTNEQKKEILNSVTKTNKK